MNKIAALWEKSTMNLKAAAKGSKRMGRFAVDIELANRDDIGRWRHGDITASEVRRITIQGIIDSGAARLVLPSKAAKQLGLKPIKKVRVKYANGSTAERDFVDGVHLSLMGRESTYNATLEPRRETALIGALVLEDLDFLIDPLKERLIPRDPAGIVSEIE